jgi:hypothetical protein
MLLCAACAQNGSATSSLSSSNPVAPAPSAAPAGRATITGTVARNITALSVRPLADATMLTVSVAGSSSAAIVDASGHFTLQNVPAGDLTLDFTGSGINAHLTLTGVRIDDRIDIMVRLNGTSAELEQETREQENEVEPPAGSNGAVQPKPDDETENEAGENEADAEVTGVVAGAASGHACPSFSFTVAGTSVTTSASTRFDDIACAAVVNGVRVEVKGTRTGGAIAATRVEKQ